MIAFVYIMASGKNGTLYTGITTNLVRRTYEHRNDLIGGFTQKYGVHRLVYFEAHGDVREAIRREKQIKKWNRAWKLRLIKRFNPQWTDLYFDIIDEHGPPVFTGVTASRPSTGGPVAPGVASGLATGPPKAERACDPTR